MRKTLALLLSLILLIGMLSACGGSTGDTATQTPTDASADAPTTAEIPVTDDLRAELAEAFDEVFTQTLFEGAAYLVRHGEEIYAGGAGKAIRDEETENGADVVYRIASNTKQFTAAAILKLCEEGRLSLDDAMSKFFPDYTIGKDITVHHLLAMISGIPDFVRSYDENGYEVSSPGPGISGIMHENTPEENRAALEAFIFSQELLFTPGERYSYSNSNYYLLGCIIEQVSGTSYYDYIRTHFFEPLGMDTAGFADDDDLPDAVIAKGYHRSNGSEYLTYRELSFASADIIATPKDLYKWTIALHSGKVLGDEMYRRMTTVQIAETGKGAGYGYGLFVALTEDGSQVFYHTGNVPGFTSFVGYFPAEDYFVAVISNYAAENTMTVANKLTELFRARITP